MKEEKKIRYFCRGKVLPDGHRKSCGFDLTGILQELPADGTEREISCPYCSCKIKVKK